MKTEESLIDKARKLCSSDAELARKLEISPALLSLMRSRDRAITTETALKLGEMLNMEARDALELAAIHNDVHGKFRDYLGKALAAGVAAVLVFSYADLPISAMESAASELTILHIVLSGILGFMQVAIVTAARRVPHCFQSVKGKACGSVLTRSHSGVRLPCGPLTA